jgi:hypothetical protein
MGRAINNTDDVSQRNSACRQITCLPAIADVDVDLHKVHAFSGATLKGTEPVSNASNAEIPCQTIAATGRDQSEVLAFAFQTSDNFEDRAVATHDEDAIEVL